jgi:hypothetical protein
MDGSRDESHTTAGLDIGDKYSYLCLIDQQSGEVIEEAQVGCVPAALKPSSDASPPSGLLCA